MRREHKRLLIVDECIGAAVVNFAINAALGWLAYRARPSLPLFGATSIATDTLATAFVLPLVTVLVATPLIRLGVARGKLPPLDPPIASPRGLPRRPRALLARGAVLGVASMLLVAAPFVAALALVGPQSVTPARMVWCKGGFAAVLAALVTPLVAWWALEDASTRTPARAT